MAINNVMNTPRTKFFLVTAPNGRIYGSGNTAIRAIKYARLEAIRTGYLPVPEMTAHECATREVYDRLVNQQAAK